MNVLQQKVATAATSPLPERWSPVEAVEDAIVVGGVELRRAGFASRDDRGHEVTGSAVEIDGEPARRAYYELLERVVVMDATRERRPSYALRSREGRPLGWHRGDLVFPESAAADQYRFSKSNGVALHATWQDAASRAAGELAERDRILRAWAGELRPARLELDPAREGITVPSTHAWIAFAVAETDSRRFGAAFEVVGVAGFPSDGEAPVALGFAARHGRSEALRAAFTEATQLLGFLWGEPVPPEVPSFAPTPVFHLEAFQAPPARELLRAWVEEGHGRFAARPAAEAPDVAFVDLTPAWLGGSAHVAKAVAPGAVELVFGAAPYLAHLPSELRIHPIA